jgi:hypothetical protein
MNGQIYIDLVPALLYYQVFRKNMGLCINMIILSMICYVQSMGVQIHNQLQCPAPDLECEVCRVAWLHSLSCVHQFQHALKLQLDEKYNMRPIRLAYQSPASSIFLSEQTSRQQSASSTFLSEQISTSHQPPAKRTC